MATSCSHYGIVVKDSHSFKLMNSVCSWLNILLAVPTSAMNMSLIIVLVSSKEWSKPCFLLLLNLAITDFLAGFVNMPVQFIVFRYIGQGKDPCKFADFTTPIGYILGFASILMITLIASERYVSVFYPFFHMARLHPRNILAAILIVWVLSISFLIPSVSVGEDTFLNASVPTIAIVCSLINFYCYARILLRARKVRLQINTEAARLGQENVRERKEKNLFSIGFLIVISITICYTPVGIVSAFSLIDYGESISQGMLCWGWTLAMASSFINPVISCTFNAAIRKRLFRMLTCRRQHGRGLQQRTVTSQRLELRSV